jgi:hypothetical protein
MRTTVRFFKRIYASFFAAAMSAGFISFAFTIFANMQDLDPARNVALTTMLLFLMAYPLFMLVAFPTDWLTALPALSAKRGLILPVVIALAFTCCVIWVALSTGYIEAVSGVRQYYFFVFRFASSINLALTASVLALVSFMSGRLYLRYVTLVSST